MTAIYNFLWGHRSWSTRLAIIGTVIFMVWDHYNTKRYWAEMRETYSIEVNN